MDNYVILGAAALVTSAYIVYDIKSQRRKNKERNKEIAENYENISNILSSQPEEERVKTIRALEIVARNSWDREFRRKVLDLTSQLPRE